MRQPSILSLILRIVLCISTARRQRIGSRLSGSMAGCGRATRPSAHNLPDLVAAIDSLFRPDARAESCVIHGPVLWQWNALNHTLELDFYDPVLLANKMVNDHGRHVFLT